MPTDTVIFFRNPDNYIRELVECGEKNAIWDQGYLEKKKIDPVKHAKLYFGDYVVRVIRPEGTAEYLPDDEMYKPSAVYPTWNADVDSIPKLEVMCQHPWGNSLEHCTDTETPVELRPIYGQKPIIILNNLPNMGMMSGKNLLIQIKEVQEDYPEVTIHLHGLYSYNINYGMGFRSSDCDPRTSAQKGKVHLPVGKVIRYEGAINSLNWIKLLNFKPSELAIPRNRCMYNIKSAVWASRNYSENFKVRFRPTREDGGVTTKGSILDDPDTVFAPVEVKRFYAGRPQPGDKFACDTCRLALDCKVYRQGAVCSLPNSESQALAKNFNTRDSGVIIEGLSRILTIQAERVDVALNIEEQFGELSPDTTNILSKLFNDGVKLAKLVDPTLRAAPSVNVNVGAGGQAAVLNGTPQAFMASVIREFESAGIRRQDITPRMIEGAMNSMGNPGGIQEHVRNALAIDLL